jgi:hypothetical protein
MQVTKPVMNPKIRNNINLLHIAEMVTPGLIHATKAAPKTRANKVKQRLIVPLKVATEPDSAYKKFLEDKIGFEES